MGKEENKNCLLRFSKPNAKIDDWSFSLPAGFSCPGAQNCLTKINRITGKIEGEALKGEEDFRCFAASQELIYPAAREQRWNNYKALQALKTTEAMAKALTVSILDEPQLKASERIRIHVGGDFFNEEYLEAWKLVAAFFSEKTFYAYTKSVPYFIGNNLPDNFKITFSYGGKYDDLIDKYRLKFSAVVNSEEEANNYVWYDKEGNENIGLEIDHDDSHAWKDDKPFALLIHGVQQAGSPASIALQKLRKAGVSSGYGKEAKEQRAKEKKEKAGKSFDDFISKQSPKPTKISLPVIEGFNFKNWLIYQETI